MNTNRIRYKQRDFHLDEIDKFTDLDWSLEKIWMRTHINCKYIS